MRQNTWKNAKQGKESLKSQYKMQDKNQIIIDKGIKRTIVNHKTKCSVQKKQKKKICKQKSKTVVNQKRGQEVT